MSFQAWSADGRRVVVVERNVVKPDALFEDLNINPPRPWAANRALVLWLLSQFADDPRVPK